MRKAKAIMRKVIRRKDLNVLGLRFLTARHRHRGHYSGIEWLGKVYCNMEFKDFPAAGLKPFFRPNLSSESF